MVVNTEYADISLPGSPMRTFVAAPKAEGQYPGIWSSVTSLCLRGPQEHPNQATEMIGAGESKECPWVPRKRT
jgi:hypothetical protein